MTLAAAHTRVVLDPCSRTRSRDEAMKPLCDILRTIGSTHFITPEVVCSRLAKYSIAELKNIYQDLSKISYQTFESATKDRKYLVTVGGPASGKTVWLEKFLATGVRPETPKTDTVYAYIDWYRSCLQEMETTYLSALKVLGSHSEEYQKAYTYWKDAACVMADILLEIALNEGYSIAHGAMVTKDTQCILEILQKECRYHTTVIHFTSELAIRNKNREALYLETGLMHYTPEEFEEQQTEFLRLLPVYAMCAHELVLFYSTEDDRNVLVGKYTKAKKRFDDYGDGELTIVETMHDNACGKNFFSGAFYVSMSTTATPESRD